MKDGGFGSAFEAGAWPRGGFATPAIRKVTGSFAGNTPETNCTSRTLLESDESSIDAEATAPEAGDENTAAVFSGIFQPCPDRVISSRPVEGIATSGNKDIVIVTSFCDARTPDSAIEG